MGIIINYCVSLVEPRLVGGGGGLVQHNTLGCCHGIYMYTHFQQAGMTSNLY